MTSKQQILRRLRTAQICGQRLAVHEFGELGISENSLSARLRELQAIGVVRSQFRDGKPFKEWTLP